MQTYFCEHCGQSFYNVRALTAALCARHPDGPNRGRHRLYEGEAARPCTCRYCGVHAPDIRNLTLGNCQRHPNGPLRGRHAPALRN